jgi:hypothetical protein
MAECRIITHRIGRPMMRLINRRAHALGGPTYFDDCRAYLLQKIERQLHVQGTTLTTEWLVGVLNSASIDDMAGVRSCAP